ncbi:tyrosine-type recombinase/integrase [Candidatus Bathyarchaeota archaeon]|nr:tyrosine-type recombinase/integrase [Candidatus Bathyarchaeota archaeon]
MMAAFQEISIFGKAGSPNSGKSDSSESAGTSPLCPQCGSTKLWRDGLRYSPFGDRIQRWLCRNCGFRFSDPDDVQRAWSTFESVERIHTKSLKVSSERPSNRQICAGVAKNLDAEQKNIEVPRRSEDIKGNLIEFAWKMQQNGYNTETIRGYGSCLRGLVARGANLADPESVKTSLAKEQKWGQNRRRNVINAYTLFLRFNEATWTKPKCKVTRKFPFIPTEQELDALIAGSHKKNAAFAQVLKETAMRSGEAKRLQWTDIDREKRIVTLNEPEKGSNPRMWKVSAALMEMLNALPRTSEQVFPGSLKSMKGTFLDTRKRLAETLQNPRLLRISFHTFRHWKATTLYHQTKDPYYVQHFLGHKKLTSTEIYINIEHTLFEAGANDEFTVKVAEKPEEIKALLEIGFEYVLQKDNLIFLRKRR